MTTTRIYRSTDTGAPVLTGQASKLIDLLDACLVNGYNSKTITITRSGTTATAACTAHGFVADQVVNISGAGQTEYNGSFRVTAVTTNDFTFEVSGSPATPATGTITCLVGPVGWTKPYTGTNKAAFRNVTGSGATGMYLRVLEDGTGTGGQREALCRAYATMSDVDTGTVPAPTVAQFANGLVWRKSNTADSTARAWTLIADELTMYLCVDAATSTAPYGCGTYSAGDFASDVAGDAYNYYLSGRYAGAAAGNSGVGSSIFAVPNGIASISVTTAGCFIGRGYAGTGDAVGAGTIVPGVGNGNAGAIAGLDNPSPGSGNIYLVAMPVMSELTIRGMFRGVYSAANQIGTGVSFGTTYTSLRGQAAGSKLYVMRHHTQANNFSAAYLPFLAVEMLLAWG